MDFVYLVVAYLK